MSSFRLIQAPLACLSSFERFYNHLILTHFNHQIYGRKNHFNLYFSYSQFTKKKIQMYQYLFYDYHPVYILATVWDNHQRQFQIPLFFCILFSTPLNNADLILATQSKLLFESNYLKSTVECLSFQISIVSNASKTIGTLFPYCRWLKTQEV